MSKKIQLIIGSTRHGRIAGDIAAWVQQQVAKNDAIDLEVVDLKEINLPFFSNAVSPSRQHDDTEAGIAWGNKISEADGFIFLTPEYNRSIPASLKNALDYLNEEWANKPAVIVSYGWIDGGQAATKHLQDVLSWLKVSVAETTLALKLGADMLNENGGIADINEAFADHESAARDALAELVSAANEPVAA